MFSQSLYNCAAFAAEMRIFIFYLSACMWESALVWVRSVILHSIFLPQFHFSCLVVWLLMVIPFFRCFLNFSFPMNFDCVFININFFAVAVSVSSCHFNHLYSIQLLLNFPFLLLFTACGCLGISISYFPHAFNVMLKCICTHIFFVCALMRESRTKSRTVYV